MFLQTYIIVIIGILSCFASSNAEPNEKKILCYMAAGAANRKGAGKFIVDNVDTDHCTHVVYAFMGLDERTNEITSIDPQLDRNALPKLKHLKKSNPAIKVLLSVGGKSQGSKRFSNMAADGGKRRIFISSVVKLLKTYQLDGLDLCWQHPTQSDGKPYDKENSLTLLKELKTAFKPENLMLTIHVLGAKYVIDSYDIKAVSEIVDYINFAALDYHGPWEKRTAPSTPLTSSDELSVKFTLDYILNKGVPPNKLLLALPMYGRSYVVAETLRGQYVGLYFDHSDRSQWTNEPGLMGFNEVCYEMTVNEQGWTEIWDDLSQTPITYNGRNVVFYDNERSLLLKAKLVGDKNLAGVMIWSLDMDDFRGLCQGGNYPLLGTIKKFINKHNSGVTTPSTIIGNEQLPSVDNNKTSIVTFEFGE